MKIKAQLRGSVYKTALFSVIALCLGLTRLNAGILFNNFGSGDTYDPSSGWSIGYGASSGNAGYSQALQFTPALSGTLSAVAVALLQAGGSNSTVSGSLMSDDNNQPGSLIETFAFSGISSAGGIYSVPSVAQPMLTAGTSYWFVVAAPDPINDMFLWYRNPAAPAALNGQRVGSGPWVTGLDYQGTLKLSTSGGPPEITVQPQNQPVVFGSNATFSVTATGATPLTYQWRMNGTDLLYATDATLRGGVGNPDELTNTFDVVVTNSSGSVTSQVAQLILVPYVYTPPESQTVAPGSNATLSVGAIGTGALSYLWRFNGTPLSGPLATNSNYTVFAAAWTNSGNYDVVVTSAAGSVTSQVAVLSVRDLTQPAIYTASNLVAGCTGPAGAQVYFGVSATDPYDSSPVVTCTPPSGRIFPIGLTTVRCVATDYVGNSNILSFTVQVTGTCDAGYIAVTCPTNLQVNLGTQPTVGVDFSVPAANLLTGQPYPVQCTPPTGSQFPVGTNLVTCVASTGGASNVCTFSVVVQDVTPPLLQVPPTIVTMKYATNYLGQGGAYVHYQVNAADNDAGVTVTCDPPSGSFFPTGTNTVTIIARDRSGNATTNLFGVLSPPPGPCGDWNADNWGFENPCVTGWTVDGFSNEWPVVDNDYITVKRVPQLFSQMTNAIGGDYWRDLYYPDGHKGTRWVCTAYQQDYGPGGINIDARFSNALTGTLVSKSFVITNNYITFLIGGNCDTNDLRVEVLFEGTNCWPWFTPVTIFGTNYCLYDYRTGHDSELMRRDWIGVSDLKGKVARIRILDNSATGHLNVDDFRFQDIAPTDETVILGGAAHPAVVPFTSNGVTYYYDWDSPVWGFADMHGHPMGHLGFGQKFLHGAPDGGPGNPSDPSIALGSCHADHCCWGEDNQGGSFGRSLIVDGTEGPLSTHTEGWNATPYKQFRKWPVFFSSLHQQMWYEWIQRAYNGGLRVMVALCENNEVLAYLDDRNGILNNLDQPVGDRQIAGLTNFVARHSDFMEIARDPWELRNIVRSNKLAIIIGSELDDIGNLSNCNFGRGREALSPADVEGEIQRLYDEGVRYLFPVHLADNRFGGTALNDSFLNVFEKLVNNRYFAITNATREENIHFWLKDLDFAAKFALDWIVWAGWLKNGIPDYPGMFDAPFGVRNATPMSSLGSSAVTNLMKRGMMIDVDHMCEETIKGAFALATNLPVNGVNYPLNCGHNSFRELVVPSDSTYADDPFYPGDGHGVPNENHRTPDQLNTVRDLGGLMGVGWANVGQLSFNYLFGWPKFCSSRIANDCPGTSKSFAQSYLYALEKFQGTNVAIGTDSDGMIIFPGPRFGPQSAYALGDREKTGAIRDTYIRAQGKDGVLYDPTNCLLTTAAFYGRAADKDRNKEQPCRTQLGYSYNRDESGFFAAISIYYYERDNALNHDKDWIKQELETIQDALSDVYPERRHIKEYAEGLIRGLRGWDITCGPFCWDGCDPGDDDVGTCQQLGKSVYQIKVNSGSELPEVRQDTNKTARLVMLLRVWDDYHKAQGRNIPMKRCQLGFKQWDINYEGVAHYGLMPDFLQDLHNVGLNAPDMSVFFRSAEAFAQMWTRCLEASAAFGGHTNLYSDLKIPRPAHLVGANRWQVGGSFLCLSTNPVSYNILGSVVEFTGTGSHTLYQPSCDRGPAQRGLTNNFAFGTLQIDGGTVTVASNGASAGCPGAVYAQALSGTGTLNIGPGVRFYFGSTNGWTGTLNITGDGVFQQLQPNPPDSVGDGLPDWWRQRYFGGDGTTTNHLSCATCDADGTGQNNWFKYVTGLDPTNPASLFTLRAAVTGQPNESQVIFSPRWTDRTYTVLFRTNLVSGQPWQNLTNANQSDNGAERTVTDLGATKRTKFYRIQITYP